MIAADQLFAQFGGGREGWWQENVWTAVLRVLVSHEGEPYTPSANPKLFEDLTEALEGLNSKLSPTSGEPHDESRSVFRAAPGPWVYTQVASFNQEIHVTDVGRAVLAGEQTYAERLRAMFVSYRERKNGKSPFRPLLETLSTGREHSFLDLFDGVQSECGPEMRDWIQSSRIKGFPYSVQPNPNNPTRSVRIMLELLEMAGLAEGHRNSEWRAADLEGVHALVTELRDFNDSEEQPHSHGATDLRDTSLVYEEITAKGWQFEPWQVAAFCHAVRTKPFVVLAGISGTGKTKLPRLVADATGAEHSVISVRPDWRDSSDLLGYTDLTGRFHPGPLLRMAKTAIQNPDREHFVLLDEMNLARVEYYFAEVLSLIEERRMDARGLSFTDPLLSTSISIPDEANGEDLPWEEVYLPANLALLGSVNMDETTHPFSRKVLDRAFVIEFSEVYLGDIGKGSGRIQEVSRLSAEAWRPTAIRLVDHKKAQSAEVRFLVDELVRVNKILSPAQLQVGYRLRDEVALFVLNLLEDPSFADGISNLTKAVDLALCMKILPRIQGGGLKTRDLLQNLSKWAGPADNPQMPMCFSRIQLLLDRLDTEGFTSFWL